MSPEFVVPVDYPFYYYLAPWFLLWFIGFPFATYVFRRWIYTDPRAWDSSSTVMAWLVSFLYPLTLLPSIAIYLAAKHRGEGT